MDEILYDKWNEREALINIYLQLFSKLQIGCVSWIYNCKRWEGLKKKTWGVSCILYKMKYKFQPPLHPNGFHTVSNWFVTSFQHYWLRLRKQFWTKLQQAVLADKTMQRLICQQTCQWDMLSHDRCHWDFTATKLHDSIVTLVQIILHVEDRWILYPALAPSVSVNWVSHSLQIRLH